jgi:hypothetical protein
MVQVDPEHCLPPIFASDILETYRIWFKMDCTRFRLVRTDLLTWYTWGVVQFAPLRTSGDLVVRLSRALSLSITHFLAFYLSQFFSH